MSTPENEVKEDLRTNRWLDKTGFVPGMTPETQIPELRYQVLNAEVFILQVWENGNTARGQMTLDELEKQLGQKITRDGWYDHLGKYLADDPGLDQAVL